MAENELMKTNAAAARRIQRPFGHARPRIKSRSPVLHQHGIGIWMPKESSIAAATGNQ
jgi:hypothetical protein